MSKLARHILSPTPLLLVAAGLANLALPASAQQTQAQTNPPPSNQPRYTIQTRVPLTIVDVVVTDSKGRPVHGLTQSDFTVLEDNQPMHPNSFEEHRADEAPSPTTSVATPALPPNAFTNVAPTPPSTRPIDLFLIDNLNTPTAMQVQVHHQMLDYLKTMSPGTRMAVFGLSSHLFVIQGFTSDPELLRAAITGSEKLMPLYSSIEDVEQEPPGMLPPKTLEEQGNDMAQRGQITFAALTQIARYLSGMTGRKNLIWSSAGFPLQFPPEPRDPSAWPPDFPQMFDFTENMKSMGDMFARAHIAVYSIEPRGLDKIIKPGIRKPLIEFGEHGTMDMVADLTGGQNFHNTNGITQAVAAAVDAGSNFYTLTYTPTNQALDTRFRSIKVTVDQPDLHLTYRDGYYAVAPGTTLAGKQVEAVTPMQSALMRGALPATEILFRVNVAQSPAPEATAPASNQPAPKLMHPPYRHYDIAYVIDVHGIDFKTSPDGNYRGDFEYGVRVYNPDGDEIVNSTVKTVSPILPPAVYKSMLNNGANAHLEIDVPATGNYFLRIAVHDLASDRVGSIEIPTSSITPTSTTAVGK